MYFPFLRGKQYELLALREIAPTLSHKPVSPIIEPTKADTIQLWKGINALWANGLNFNIVLNSSVVGKNTLDCMNSVANLIESNLKNNTNFQIAVNINQYTNFQDLEKFLVGNRLQDHSFTLIHLSKLDDIQSMKNFIINHRVKYNVLHIENVKVRYKRNFETQNCVSLSDSFNQQKRNADYSQIPEELFSEEFIFYKQEGFIGFSDFLTVGETFSDSGFTPYVVVIHLTYLKGQEIRVAHFSSTSNKDTNSPIDLPKKFKEALNRLMNFVNDNSLNNTKALEEFRNLHFKSHFPGLGSVKKLSIMNHLELVSTLI